MTPGSPSEGDLLALEPSGADRAPGMISLLAQAGGTLVGAIVNGLVRSWIADDDGQLTLVMWPGNFRARFDPLEIVDDQNRTVAHGGRQVLLAGGYLKREDARALGHHRVFCAWQVSEAQNPARTNRPPARRRPFRDSRLPTTEDQVTHLSATVAQACATIPWVRSAFICRVRREFRDDRSVQTFLGAFVVAGSPRGEGLPTARELLALLPSSLQQAGIHVLTESSVANAAPLGVQVYERGEE